MSFRVSFIISVITFFLISTSDAKPKLDIPTPETKLTLPFDQDDINLKADVISPYGVVRPTRFRDKANPGIDFPLNKGSDIYAVADGIITLVQPGIKRRRPGDTIVLLVGFDRPFHKGWAFIYGNIKLDPWIKKDTVVKKGQKIGTTPTKVSSLTHFEYAYWFGNFLYEQQCWVDHLESDKFAKYFKGVIRRKPAFKQSWTNSVDKGTYTYRQLLSYRKYREGAQLCYPLGTDARTPVKPSGDAK